MNTDKKKDDGILKHSIVVAPNFNYPPKDFYDRVEAELKSKKLPGLSLSRVEYSEGGMLSDKRIYLRVIRERFIFDTCAAPFGSEFFFSYRSVYFPAKLKVWHVLFVIAFFLLVYWPLFRLYGEPYASISLLCVILAVAKVFENAVMSELSDLDALLLKIPAFGIIYEVFFRKDTYYREDTRLLYLEIIPRIVQGIIEEITAEKGVKLNQFERAPILGDLYKPKQKAT